MPQILNPSKIKTAQNYLFIMKYLSLKIATTHFDDKIELFCQLLDGFIFAMILNRISTNIIPLSTLKDPINFDGNKPHESYEYNLKIIIEKSKELNVDIQRLTPNMILQKDDLVIKFLMDLIEMAHILSYKIKREKWIFALLNENEGVDDLEFWDGEEIMIRYINWHLNEVKTNNKQSIKRLYKDTKDSKLLFLVLKNIRLDKNESVNHENLNLLCTEMNCHTFFNESIFTCNFGMMLFLGDIMEKYPPNLSEEKIKLISNLKNKKHKNLNENILKAKSILISLKSINKKLEVLLNHEDFEEVDEICSDILRLNHELDVLEEKIELKNTKEGIFKKILRIVSCGCINR